MFKIEKGGLVGGVLATLIGVAALYQALRLPLGTLSAIGPGFLPAVYSTAILVGGMLLFVRNLTVKSYNTEDIYVRPLIIIACALIFFVLTIERLGLFIAIAGSAAISTLAGERSKALPTLLLVAGLSFGAVVLFVYALGIPVRAWPW